MDKEKNYALRGMGAAAALAAAPAAAMAGISMLSAPGEEAPQVRIAGTRLTDGEEIDLPLLGAHLDRLPVSFSDGGELLAGNSFSAFPVFRQDSATTEQEKYSAGASAPPCLPKPYPPPRETE